VERVDIARPSVSLVYATPRVTNNASCNWVNLMQVSSVRFVCCENGLTVSVRVDSVPCEILYGAALCREFQKRRTSHE